jgi:hypothetical protein
MENIKWRVMLIVENETGGEDSYCLADNFMHETAAERHAYKLQHEHPNDGLVVEAYKA